MKKLSLILAFLLMGICANAVTFNVTVPANTIVCYVVGDFNGWDAVNGVEMTRTSDTSFTLDLPDVTTTQVANG